jgi:hypothetical protein
MAYASLADVKAYLGITTSGDDALLTALIARAQSAIDAYTHRTFEASADTTKRFDADYDTFEGMLDWTPYGLDLCAITSVVNGDGVTITSTQYVTEPRHSTPYYGIRLKASTGLTWEWDNNSDSENAIAITGRWAYSITAPADIVHAAIRLSAFYYRQKDSGTFETVAYPESGIIQTPMGFPKDVEVTLRPYVRML